MSVYSRLLKLYNKNKDSGKIPLEDYVTEILVGLLKSDSRILEDFAKDILNIEGEGFKIESQRKFFLEDDVDCIIDVVLENDSTLCFLENKVNSVEGNRQLERYTKVLKNTNKNIYLRYCTKYYDKKDIKDIDFKQFRWINVYKFFEKYKENILVTEFLDFLRGENMNSAGDFNFEDMIVLSNINSTFSKINECFDCIKNILPNDFKLSKRTSTIKQFNNSDGYWLWEEYIFGKGYSEYYIGFAISEIDDKVIPVLNAGIKCEKGNDKFDKFKIAIERDNISFDFKDVDEYEAMAWFEEPISNFISSKNQLEEIEKWFRLKIEQLIQFKSINKHLDWN